MEAGERESVAIASGGEAEVWLRASSQCSSSPLVCLSLSVCYLLCIELYTYRSLYFLIY